MALLPTAASLEKAISPPVTSSFLTVCPCPKLSTFSLSSFAKCQNSSQVLKAPRRGGTCRLAVVVACSENGSAGTGLGLKEEEEGERRFDVSSSCVAPVFRSSPLEAEEAGGNQVKILFLSEGNVCRSIYAEAIFNKLISEQGLSDKFSCASRATRDYNLGEEPDSRAVEIASEFNLELTRGKIATMFEPSSDIVSYDVAVVMDKFVAADVLKEVSVYDTINPQANYSAKVRRLGDFSRERRIEDIDDPLYGNMGGPDELENLRQVYKDTRASCEGLLESLCDVESTLEDGKTLAEGVSLWLRGMEALDWMVPPMLQKKKT